MTIYHWTDENNNSFYSTNKEEARRRYNRMVKIDDPGAWCEMEVVALLKQKDYDLARQRHIISRLGGLLDPLISEDIPELIDEAADQYDKLMARLQE